MNHFTSSPCFASPGLRRAAVLLLALVLLAGSVFTPVQAQTPPTAPSDNFGFELTDQTGGTVNALAVSGGQAFVGAGMRVYLLDIGSNPGHVSNIFVSPILSDSVQDIQIYGNHAYVCVGKSGLVILDISVPTQISVVGTLPSRGTTNAAVVVDKYAYLAESVGVRIIDVSNNAQPKEVAFLETERANSIRHQGNYLYVAAGQRFLVIDKSNFGNVHIEGEVSSFTSAVSDVALSGSTAYVSSSKTLYLINVAEPDALDIASEKTFPVGGKDFDIHSLDLYGNWLFIGGTTGSGAYYLQVIHRHYNSITLIDANSPVVGAAADDANYLYTIERNRGMSIYIYDEPDFIPTGGKFLMDFTSLNGLSRAGTKLYGAGSENGVTAFDLSDRFHPSFLATENTPGDAFNVTSAGNRVYVADGDGGMRILDANTLSEVGYWDQGDYQISDIAIWTPGTIIGGQVVAYVAHQNGFEILNVTNPAAITWLNARATQNKVQQLTLFKPAENASYIYVSTNKGMEIYDVSAHDSITLKGTYLTDSIEHDLDVQRFGSSIYAFLAGPSGLEIVDVTNPAQPQRASKVSVNARSVRVVNGMAFVTGVYGVYAIDVSKPATPRFAGAYHTGTALAGVHAYQEPGTDDVTVYVTNAPYGLLTLRFKAERVFLPMIVR